MLLYVEKASFQREMWAVGGGGCGAKGTAKRPPLRMSAATHTRFISDFLPLRYFLSPPTHLHIPAVDDDAREKVLEKVFIFEKYWKAQEATIKRGFRGNGVEKLRGW